MQDHDAASRPGRHRARTRLKKLHVIALTGLALLGVGVTAGTASADPTAQDWANIRGCESGGDYSINTGNGYYGAYQFDLGTWRSVGGSGLPSDASPAEQDARALALWRSRGWSPWACASLVSLSDGTAAPSAPAAPAAPVAKPSPYPKISAAKATVWTEQVYRRALLRGGAGNPFAGALIAGQGSYTTVADYISNSEERTRHIVDAAYVDCLGRHGDAGGITAYAGWLRAGNNLGGLYVALCSSTEAFARAGNSFSKWATMTSTRAAGAKSSLVGLSGDTSAAGRRAAAISIVNSATWRNFQLDRLYIAVLSRHVDNGGIASFAGLMPQRGIFSVVTALTTSSEFLDKF